MNGRRVGVQGGSAGLRAWLLCTLVLMATASSSISLARSRRPKPEPGPAAQAAATPILPAYQTVVLPNGLTLLIMEQHELPLVDFRLLIKIGSSGDPKGREGLAAATAELLRQGTRQKTAAQFAEAVEFLGGTLDTGSDRDKSWVSGEFLSRDFQKGLELLAEMVQTPSMRHEEVSRVREQTLAGIQQDLDDPEAIANKQFAKALYGEHPYARPVEGTAKSIQAIQRLDVARFHTTYYVPNNSILAIVGDITTDSAVAAAKMAFAGWAKKPVPKAEPSIMPVVKGRRVVIVDKPDVNQTQIRIGTIGIRRSDPAYFPAMISGTILGGGFTSWLNQEIREKRGLSYGASARFETRLEPGPIVVSTFTKNETVKETITVALDTLKRFQDGKVTFEDLRKAQNYRSGQYPLTVETTDQLANQVADLVFYGLKRDFVDQQIDQLHAVTLEALKPVAQMLPVSDYVLVVVTNAAAVRPQLEGFGTIEVVPYDAPE